MTQIKPSISNRNGKLGNFVYHFSISVDSCVCATPHCVRYCYAKRGKIAIHQKGIYKRNYEATKLDSFVGDMIDLIRPLYLDLRYFRIHTSGDFYSQKYFNKWIEIVNEFPNMKFLAFTRNTRIKVYQSYLPSNINVIFSSDESTQEFNPTISQVARVIYEPTEEVKHMGFAIDGYYCDSTCKTCRYCWTYGRNINFVLKGIKRETLIKLTTV